MPVQKTKVSNFDSSFFFFFFLQVDVCLLLANSMYRYSFPSSNQKKYVFFYNIVAKLRLSQFSEVCALFFAFSNIANANASVEHLPTSSSTVIQPFYKREREKEKKKSKDLFCGVTACYFFSTEGLDCEVNVDPWGGPDGFELLQVFLPACTAQFFYAGISFSTCCKYKQTYTFTFFQLMFVGTCRTRFVEV